MAQEWASKEDVKRWCILKTCAPLDKVVDPWGHRLVTDKIKQDNTKNFKFIQTCAAPNSDTHKPLNEWINSSQSSDPPQMISSNNSLSSHQISNSKPSSPKQFSLYERKQIHASTSHFSRNSSMNNSSNTVYNNKSTPPNRPRRICAVTPPGFYKPTSIPIRIPNEFSGNYSRSISTPIDVRSLKEGSFDSTQHVSLPEVRVCGDRVHQETESLEVTRLKFAAKLLASRQKCAFINYSNYNSASSTPLIQNNKFTFQQQSRDVTPLSGNDFENGSHQQLFRSTHDTETSWMDCATLVESVAYVLSMNKENTAQQHVYLTKSTGSIPIQFHEVVHMPLSDPSSYGPPHNALSVFHNSEADQAWYFNQLKMNRKLSKLDLTATSVIPSPQSISKFASLIGFDKNHNLPIEIIENIKNISDFIVNSQQKINQESHTISINNNNNQHEIIGDEYFKNSQILTSDNSIITNLLRLCESNPQNVWRSPTHPTSLLWLLHLMAVRDKYITSDHHHHHSFTEARKALVKLIGNVKQSSNFQTSLMNTPPNFKFCQRFISIPSIKQLAFIRLLHSRLAQQLRTLVPPPTVAVSPPCELPAQRDALPSHPAPPLTSALRSVSSKSHTMPSIRFQDSNISRSRSFNPAHLEINSKLTTHSASNTLFPIAPGTPTSSSSSSSSPVQPIVKIFQTAQPATYEPRLIISDGNHFSSLSEKLHPTLPFQPLTSNLCMHEVLTASARSVCHDDKLETESALKTDGSTQSGFGSPQGRRKNTETSMSQGVSSPDMASPPPA